MAVLPPYLGKVILLQNDWELHLCVAYVFFGTVAQCMCEDLQLFLTQPSVLNWCSWSLVQADK